MKKNKSKEPEIIFMSCNVCTSCYRENIPGRDPRRCHFGGPYFGYKFVK